MAWNIYGHENAVEFLRVHTEAAKLRQAYLITGPQGVGRKTLALAFIKAICCQNPPEQGGFCGECISCRQIEARNFSDLNIVQAEAGKEIKIEQIREMQRTLVLAPFQAPRRFVLIPDFQRATAGASNALLKSLEEPPSRAVIILTADAKESVLETIASRCEIVRLHPLSIAEAERTLVEQFSVEEEMSSVLAHLNGGRLGAALRMVEDLSSLDLQHDALSELEDLLQSSMRARLQYSEALLKQKKSPREIAGKYIPFWLGFWRDCLIFSSGADLPLVNSAFKNAIARVADQLSEREIRTILLAHEHALQQIETYANARLVMENLLLMPPRIKSS